MKKGNTSRENIIASSIKIFSVHGYHNTSLKMIAEKCKIAQSTILHHFPTQHALLAEIDKRIVSSNISLVDGLSKPEDNALVLLNNYFAGNYLWTQKHKPEAQMRLLFYYMASHDRIFRKFLTESVNRGRQRISNILHAGIREKIFIKTIDVDFEAIQLHTFIVGCLITLLASPNNPPDNENIHRLWMQQVEHLLLSNE
jgi:AcrR family transcriptional regulator